MSIIKSETPEELQKAFHYLFEGEVDFLRKLAAELPLSPKVVNIGAGAGTSTSVFLHERLDAMVYSIDITDASSPYGSLQGEQVALEGMGLLDVERYKPIVGKSHDIADAWQHGLVDFIFVDDGHSYKECFGDISKWLPHLKKDGIIAIHDFDKWEHAQKAFPELTKMQAKPWPGVDQAVRDLLCGTLEFAGIVATIVAFYNRTANGVWPPIVPKMMPVDEIEALEREIHG